jgi:hypothetical protein
VAEVMSIEASITPDSVATTNATPIIHRPHKPPTNIKGTSHFLLYEFTLLSTASSEQSLLHPENNVNQKY